MHKKLRIVTIIGCLLFICPSTWAEGLTNKSRCDFVKSALDQNDADRASDIRNYIIGVMNGLDEAHIKNGEPGIMAALSDDGLSKIVEFAASKCIKNSKMTIFNAAAQTYSSIRHFEMVMGQAR